MKKLLSLGTLILSMVLLSPPVHASGLEEPTLKTDTKLRTAIDEVEGNDEQSNAQEVPYNNPNPDRIVSSSDWSDQNVLKGVLKDNNDVDWYKVYVPNGKRAIFSINLDAGKNIHFNVLDENGNKIKSEDFTKPSNFMGAYPIGLNTSLGQYYFVEITSNENIEYSFSLGGPNYEVDSYTYKAPKPLQIQSTTKKEVTAKYDLTASGAKLPNEAKVFQFTFSGKKQGSIINENRYVKWPTNSTWTKTKPYVWQSEMSSNLNNYLKNTWEVKLEGTSKGGYTLYPELNFRYIYPVTPENVL